jgi:hypothetical protein
VFSRFLRLFEMMMHESFLRDRVVEITRLFIEGVTLSAPAVVGAFCDLMFVLGLHCQVFAACLDNKITPFRALGDLLSKYDVSLAGYIYQACGVRDSEMLCRAVIDDATLYEILACEDGMGKVVSWVKKHPALIWPFLQRIAHRFECDPIATYNQLCGAGLFPEVFDYVAALPVEGQKRVADETEFCKLMLAEMPGMAADFFSQFTDDVRWILIARTTTNAHRYEEALTHPALGLMERCVREVGTKRGDFLEPFLTRLLGGKGIWF